MSINDENCFRKEDRDELLKQGWQLSAIVKTLEEMKGTFKENAIDWEQRIRALENFKWIVWGMGSIGGILVGYILQLMIGRK
jgi:hypothetical protein